MTERIEKLISFLSSSPDDCFLNHALALEYIKAGNEQAARERFEHNLQTDAGYVATYYHLGKLLERTNDMDAALKIYEAGMQIARKAGDNHAYNELQAAYEDLAC